MQAGYETGIGVAAGFAVFVAYAVLGVLGVLAALTFFLWVGARIGQFYLDDVIKSLPRGQIIAVCRLGDCFPTRSLMGIQTISEQEQAFGDFSEGRFGFVLKNIRKLDVPIPAKGSLGLWEFPLEVTIR